MRSPAIVLCVPMESATPSPGIFAGGVDANPGFRYLYWISLSARATGTCRGGGPVNGTPLRAHHLEWPNRVSLIRLLNQCDFLSSSTPAKNRCNLHQTGADVAASRRDLTRRGCSYPGGHAIVHRSLPALSSIEVGAELRRRPGIPQRECRADPVSGPT